MAVSLIPLLIYLNQTSGDLARAIAALRDYQSQKETESLGIVYDSTAGGIVLKNTGPIPVTIVLATVNSGTCGLGDTILRTSITMYPGNTTTSIKTTGKSYSLGEICYVATARGNVFPVKEKYAQLAQQIQIFTRNNTLFAANADIKKIQANYSTTSYICNMQGNPAIINFANYPRQVLTIIDNNNNIISFGGSSNNVGCFLLIFKNLVQIRENPYAVVVYYRIVLQGTWGSNNKLGVNVAATIYNDTVRFDSTTSETSWTPNSINVTYLVLERYVIIPVSGATPGLYNLSITGTLDLQGSTQLQVGLEYLAVQGATLVVG